MAGYKRLVSYIYNYEEGQKEKNIGYIRLERMEGKCKLYLHMRCPHQLEGMLYLYFYYEKMGELLGIFFGECALHAGTAEFRFTGREAEILPEDSFEQISGVVCFLNKCAGKPESKDCNRYYGSQWDEKVIELKAFRLKEPFSVPDERTVPVQPIGEKQEIKVEENQDRIPPEEPVKPRTLKENILKTDNSQRQDNPQRQDKPQLDNSQLDNPPLEMDETVSGKKGSSGEIQVEFLSQAKSFRKNIIREKPLDSDFLEKLTKIKSRPEGELCQGLSREERLRLIFTAYPKLLPFEEQKIEDCVRIEPQDIGLFPMDSWVLANNSFLLHGYYCYRHLIFAKKHFPEGKEEEYIIGVPGMYHNRERFMAKMFGFEEFQPIKGENPETGAFGYWYQKIAL